MLYAHPNGLINSNDDYIGHWITIDNRIMNSNTTATSTLPELRVNVDFIKNHKPTFKLSTSRLLGVIERMYDGHYRVVWTTESPHLILIQSGIGIRKDKFVLNARKPGNQKSFIILWTLEPGLPPSDIADHSISYYSDTATNTWFPEMLYQLDEDFVALLNGQPTQRFLTNRKNPRPNFCAFVHYQSPKSHNDVKKAFGTRSSLSHIKARNDFCAELMKYKKVLCPSKVMNNVPTPDYMREGEFTTGLIRFLSECKFFICFENTLSSRQDPSGMKYVTPKILAAFIAGSIPIYSGYREIAELFNPAAFINANDFSSHQELIEYIKEVDNSPELTAAYQNAPPILPDSPLHNLHPDKMRSLFLSLAERALERAANSSTWQLYYLRRSYYATRFNIDLKIAELNKLILGPPYRWYKKVRR